MDISSLYSQLTVDARRYQELHRSDLAAKAADRWPLLKDALGSLRGGREQDRHGA